MIEQYVNPEEKGLYLLPKIQSLNGDKIAALPAKEDQRSPDQEKAFKAIESSTIAGGKLALKWTAAVPATMAVGYLLLLGYFQLQGGYKPQLLMSPHERGEMLTGGVQGPVE